MITAPRMLTIAALAAFGLGSPLYAKAPAKADEDAIRAMIEKVYAGYMREIPEAPEDGSYAPTNDAGEAFDGYDLPSTASLDVLIDKLADFKEAGACGARRGECAPSGSQIKNSTIPQRP